MKRIINMIWRGFHSIFVQPTELPPITFRGRTAEQIAAMTAGEALAEDMAMVARDIERATEKVRGRSQ